MLSLLNGTYVPVKESALKPDIPTELSYEEKVVALIRARYSLDEELAIQRQRDTKPEEFSEYFSYCEECKQRAKEEM